MRPSRPCRLLAEAHVRACRVVRGECLVRLEGEARVRLGHAIVLADLVRLEAGGDFIDGRVRVFQPIKDDIVLGQSFQRQTTLVLGSGSYNRSWITEVRFWARGRMRPHGNYCLPKLRFGWKNRDFALARCFWFVGFEVDEVPRTHFFPFTLDLSLDLNLPISVCESRAACNK